MAIPKFAQINFFVVCGGGQKIKAHVSHEKFLRLKAATKN